MTPSDRTQLTLLNRIEAWALQNGHRLAFGVHITPRRPKQVTACLMRLDSNNPWMTAYGNTTNEALRNLADGLIEDGHGADIAA